MGIGMLLLLVAAAGALFPFVPIIFSDAKYLTEQLETLPVSSLGDATIGLPESSPSEPSATGATATPRQKPPEPTPIPESPGDNRLFIDKIGVSVKIAEGKDSGAMLYGAWRYPVTSTPSKDSNTVLFGHRFRYIPPNNTTFYHLDKMAVGDSFKARWSGKVYTYKVTHIGTILPTDFSVVQPTKNPTMTLITCAPLFSTKERLVVVGELLDM